MAELGSKLNNNWLSSVLTVSKVEEWWPSSLVLVQAAWACDIYEADNVPLSSNRTFYLKESDESSFNTTGYMGFTDVSGGVRVPESMPRLGWR